MTIKAMTQINKSPVHQVACVRACVCVRVCQQACVRYICDHLHLHTVISCAHAQISLLVIKRKFMIMPTLMYVGLVCIAQRFEPQGRGVLS